MPTETEWQVFSNLVAEITVMMDTQQSKGTRLTLKWHLERPADPLQGVRCSISSTSGMWPPRNNGLGAPRRLG